MTEINLETELEIETGLPKKWFNEEGVVVNEFKTAKQLIENEKSRYMLETTGLYYSNTTVKKEVWDYIKSFRNRSNLIVKKDRVIIQHKDSSIYIENHKGDLIL